MRIALIAIFVAATALALSVSSPLARQAAAATACRSSVGPGIPPPASVPSGIPGFHAAWYGQSGYPSLCPGERSTATVAYYNSGSRGWISGRMGEMAFLGTSDPFPGQDNPSQLGGAAVSVFTGPPTGWPANNRPAAQPAEYVGPNQVAWFQFTIQAPKDPGLYLLYLRPVVEGATWMEDYGVFWLVRVLSADPPQPISVSPTTREALGASQSRQYTAIVNGTSDCVDLAFVDADVYEQDIHGFLPDRDSDGHADLSAAATFATVSGATAGASYVDCVSLPADRTLLFTVTAPVGVSVRPIVFRDLNRNNALDLPRLFSDERTSENWAWGLGGVASFAPPTAVGGTYDERVGAVSHSTDWFADATLARSFRYDANDTFQIGSAPVAMFTFEQHLSRGDTVSMTYVVDPSAVSTFNIANDMGVAPPRVDTAVGAYNGGTTPNDVQVTLSAPPSNVDETWYSVERAPVATGTTTCGSTSGTYDSLRYLLIAGGQSKSYLDADRLSGTYCYRSAVLNESSFAYSAPVRVD